MPKRHLYDKAILRLLKRLRNWGKNTIKQYKNQTKIEKKKEIIKDEDTINYYNNDKNIKMLEFALNFFIQNS